MIRVIEELCTGCGLCVTECSQDAIRLAFGRARIDQRRCISCYTCVEICPQGAIRDEVQVSMEEVRALVDGLSAKADAVMKRIDGLTRKDGAR